MPNLRRLLAHNHWLTLNVFGVELQLCARCSGTVLGFIGSKILLNTTFLMNYSITFHIGFLVSLLFFLPTIVDWTTQSLGFRQSNNRLRLTTGFLDGIGIVFLGLADITFVAKFFILTISGLVVLSVGIFGRKITQKNILRPQYPNALD